MVKCPWCGKEYADGQQFCPTDATPLAGPKEAAALAGPKEPAKADPAWAPEFLNLAETKGAFQFEEGYSRPDWKVIAQTIQRRVSDPEHLDAAWCEAARQWVRQIRSDLGGDYRVMDSRRFILLTALDAETGSGILEFAEVTLDRIGERLKGAAWNPRHGKHVVLLFMEEDDYYQYVMYFHQEGIHPRTGGCLIHQDYVHIAALYTRYGLHQVLTHELLHNCVVHLKLPLWLNEGLAVMFERTAGSGRGPIMDYELKERHEAFWNAGNIQEFWAGVSFDKPGDANELSYSLAEIVLNLLLEQGGDWGLFLKQAQWADAGQTAAIECLGADLGVVVSTFLGEGDWRPRRKAMVDLWEARKGRQSG
jgi:hypothetical protein